MRARSSGVAGPVAAGDGAVPGGADGLAGGSTVVGAPLAEVAAGMLPGAGSAGRGGAGVLRRGLAGEVVEAGFAAAAAAAVGDGVREGAGAALGEELSPSRAAGTIGSGDGAGGMESPPMRNGSGPSRAAAPRGGGAAGNAGVAACSGRAEAGGRVWACPGLVSDGSNQISRSGARWSRKRHRPRGRLAREKLSASGRNRWPSPPCMGLSDEGNTDPGRRPKF